MAQLFQNTYLSAILDLGCGSGRHAIYFANRGFRVHGFDQCSTAVSRAVQLLGKEKLSAALRVWDMTKFPYPYDNSFFDAVMAIRVIHHTYMANIKQIAGEIGRITRKGGYLYLQVPTYEKALRLREEGKGLRELEPRTPLPLEGDEKGIPHHYFTEDELLSAFSGYEARDIRIREEHYCLTAIKK